jgi:antitoxin MazE
MRKKLTRTGNSLALILDRPLLEQTGISEETALEISTDGDVIILTPVRSASRARKIRKALASIHAEYAGVFERLAK